MVKWRMWRAKANLKVKRASRVRKVLIEVKVVRVKRVVRAVVPWNSMEKMKKRRARSRAKWLRASRMRPRIKVPQIS